MSKQQFKSFERVFPSRELFRGKALRAVIWSALGALALCLLLFDLFLVVGLLETRGRLDLPGSAIGEIQSLETGAVDASADVRIPERVYREDSGILPLVWRSRGKFWGPMLAVLYRKVPALQSNSNGLILLVLAAVLIGFLRRLMIWRARRLSAVAALGTGTRLRGTLHRQSLRLGPDDLEDKETDNVLTLFTDEIDLLREGIALWIERLGRYPLEAALLLAFALALDWLTALQCLIPLGFCWYLLHSEKRHNQWAQQRAEARTEAELRLLAEGFRKTRLVRGFGMEKFEHEQFQKHLGRFHDKLVSAGQGGLWTYWACRVFVTGCVAFVLYLVGTKVLRSPDEFLLAVGLTLLATIACMYRPLETLAQLKSDRENASLAADRVFRYLNRIPDVSQAVGAKFLHPLSKAIQFDSVTYQLPSKETLLDRLDLKITAGSVIAVVAINPLEARCLAYLLPRFIEPNSGRILIDGEDIAWVTLESLRAETVYVGGTDPFFTGTVLENISCGNAQYSLQQVTEAAKAAHAHGFILKLPQGY